MNDWTRAVPVALCLSMAAAASGAVSPPQAQNLVRFGVNLYGELRKQPGNVLFSPHSVSAILAAAHAGARGKTESQFAAVVGYGTASEALRAVEEVETRLEASGAAEGVEVATASSLWIQRDYRLRQEFLSRVRFTAESLDFATDPERARETINRWVEANTRNRVEDLLSPGIIDPLTRLVLVSAVFFQARWSVEFPRELTRESDFRTPSGSLRRVPLMRRQATFPYSESPRAQALEIPYAGDAFSLFVLLPRAIDGLGVLEESLSSDDVLEIVEAAQPTEVDVLLPRFRVSARWDLRAPLEAMGLEDAFSSAADFSGMTEAEELYVGALVHQAVIEVSEEGTQAAAGTAATLQSRSLPPSTVEFRADRPFLFFIRERASGAILFLGRLAEP